MAEEFEEVIDDIPEQEEEEEELEEKPEKPEKKPKTKKKPSENRGFEFMLDNPQILKVLIDTLSTIIDETEIIVSPRTLHITAMDPSRICIILFTMKSTDFDSYKCSAETKVALNLKDFNKILKRCLNKEKLTFVYNDVDKKIKLQFKQEDSKVRSFSLTSLDLDIEDLPMENLMKLEYPAQWKMDPEIMIEAIKDAEIYADLINIEANQDEGLRLTSSGMIGEMNYHLSHEELIEPEITEKQFGSYSLNFLKPIMNLRHITESYGIALKSDHPMKFLFDIIEGAKVLFFVAPRVENYDDVDPEEEREEF